MPSTPESPRASEAADAPAGDVRGTAGSTLPQSVRSSIHELSSGLDHSSIMGVELIAGFLTWAGIGWLLDRWLGTGPWLLVIGALVGNAAGLYLIFLRSKRMEGYDDAPRRFDAPSPAVVTSAPPASAEPATSVSPTAADAAVEQGGRR
jgi:F0F1-type ATP synthase assembly protein I